MHSSSHKEVHILEPSPRNFEKSQINLIKIFTNSINECHIRSLKSELHLHYASFHLVDFHPNRQFQNLKLKVKLMERGVDL